MSVDVVIVSFNTRDLLRNCLKSLSESQDELGSGDVIVVDNASSDGSPEMVLQEFPNTVFLGQSVNLGFGAANNCGFQAGSSPYVLFLNSDTVVRRGSISALREVLVSDALCIAVGPRLVYPDGSFHPSCRRFPTVTRGIWQLSGMEGRLGKPRFLCNWLSESEHRAARYVDMVSGACFMVSRPLFESVGLFDETLFLYEEEMDIFLRARRKGLRVRYVWEAIIEHHHGASSGEKTGNPFAQFHQFRSKYYCFRKHYGTFRARLAYGADQSILGLSAWINRTRGTASPAADLKKLSRDAFRDAFSI